MPRHHAAAKVKRQSRLSENPCLRLCVPRCANGRAFSLVEMVLVVVIIGIISAIAVPRMTSGAASANAAALESSLSTVRKAIDIYYAEHGKYPGYDPISSTPDGADFLSQLIDYTDTRGRASSTYAPPYIYGPYLRRPFPKNPFNGLDTVHVKAFPGDADPADGAVGWVAVLSHGYFGISATDTQFEGAGIDIDDVVKRQVFRGKGLSGL